MRVSRSTVESLIINLVMVKEEDKGRGCVPANRTNESFHGGLSLIIQREAAVITGIHGWNEKIPV
jgi:hypothetical protein